MPILDATTAPPRSPCRILVAGASGSGKTTLAARLGVALGIPHITTRSLA